MRIALLTIWHEKNYGAELQAYATIKILKSLGHDVTIIDIRLSDTKYVSLKGRVADFISWFGPERRKFDKFWNRFIVKTRRYKNLSELQSNPPKADVYIVGSDQVWNPDITKQLSLAYFLDFGPDKIKRIAYASSFGVEKWNYENIYDRVKFLLNRFSYVSCREYSGVRLLQDTFSLQAKHVLDPTLLFEDYYEITGRIEVQDILVYYPLSNDEELESYSIELALKLGLKAVNNNECKLLFDKLPWDRVGIEEWVRNIAQARFVITRSFHGLVFSLIYKRPFAVLASRNGRGNRLTDLLERIGLSDRMYPSVELLNEARPWEKKIDYNIVDSVLRKERKFSIDFLLQSLKKTN